LIIEFRKNRERNGSKPGKTKKFSFYRRLKWLSKRPVKEHKKVKQRTPRENEVEFPKWHFGFLFNLPFRIRF